MPPLQNNLLSPDSPTMGRRTRRRGSAKVPYEVLHSSKLWPIEPAPEEPNGVCIYANHSVLTKGEELVIQKIYSSDDQDKTCNSSAQSMAANVSRRSGRRRETRNSTLSMESKAPFCAWSECVDIPCIVS